VERDQRLQRLRDMRMQLQRDRDTDTSSAGPREEPSPAQRRKESPSAVATRTPRREPSPAQRRRGSSSSVRPTTPRREPSPVQRKKDPSSMLSLSCSTPGPSDTAGSLAGSSVGPASLYARGEAWLEKKRLREKELREEALRDEVKKCTFCPNSSTGSAALVTPDRARQLFDRQLSWRQRLDDECERLRREKREASEREVEALRKTGAAVRSHSARGRGEASVGDSTSVFSSFYQRNREWQRVRDERLERLHHEEIARHMRPSEREGQVRAASSNQRCRSESLDRSVRAGARSSGGDTMAGAAAATLPTGEVTASSAPAATMAAATVAAPEEPVIPTSAADAGASLQQSASQPVRPVHAVPGQPIRAPWSALGPNLCTESSASDSHERTEIFSRLESLRRCLASSESRGTPLWQRAIRVDRARMGGAGAAPLRSRKADVSSSVTMQEQPSVGSIPPARDRAFSPLPAGCKWHPLPPGQWHGGAPRGYSRR